LTTAPFDTLKLARALRDAHFSNEQAEGMAYAIAEAVQTDLATKSDLREMELRLDSKIATLGAELRADLGATRTDLRAEIGATRADLRAEIGATRADLHAEIAASKAELIKWVFGAIGFQTLVILGALITLIRVVRP
jgi:hypothetical protein